MLYHAFCDIRLLDPHPTPEDIAANLKLRPTPELLKQIRELPPNPFFFISRFSPEFWADPLLHLASDPSANDGISRELPAKVFSEMAANKTGNSRKPFTEGNSWEATLMLLEYANRIPAVRVPVAAKILQITEKTVYNQCGKNLECIPHKGTTWVTKQSIQAWVNRLYRPTAEFNLWNNVMEELEKYSHIAKIKQEIQKQHIDTEDSTKSL
jgi:hypothetical protein